MLIQINTNTKATGLGLILVQNFYLQMKVWKKYVSFGAGSRSSVPTDNKNKDILILGEKATPGLDDTTLTAKAKYPIDFTQSRKRFMLSLHYNGRKSFLFVNSTKTYQIKAKDSEIKGCHCV